MKIKKNYFEAGAFILVYLFALYMWTLPFQDNKTPYGEFDAISHWELGDFIAQRDRTFVYLPPFLDYSYADEKVYLLSSSIRTKDKKELPIVTFGIEFEGNFIGRLNSGKLGFSYSI